MQLPYGIIEQYQLFHTFILESSKASLHIEEPYPETETILQTALEALDPRIFRIQYFESDSCLKRILTNKLSGQMKRILLGRPYALRWIWKNYKTFSLPYSLTYH